MDAWWQWDAWSETPPSVLVVMATGILAGSVVKAITGFGSTIAHLCIWSVARAAGFNAGTLQQAVVTEVVFRTVTAVPYLYATNARETANLKLVVSISLFQELGSVLGAWLLLILDQRVLELCLAAALVLVLLGQLVTNYVFSRRCQTKESLSRQQRVESATSVDTPISRGSATPRAYWSSSTVHQHGLDDPLLSCEAGRDNNKGDTKAGAGEEDKGREEEGEEEEGQEVERGFLQGAGDWRQWAVLLLAGSVAGTLSGVMGGLTGIDGPPTIFMFTMLAADKATVRGTNAVINCLLMTALLTAYAVGGLFTWRDMPLYVAGSVFGVVGTAWGNRLSHHLSQAAFTRLLNLMVVVCAALMTLSGLGLAGF